MFFRKKKVKSHAKKFDRLITWLIVWWAIASMIWLSKSDKWKEVTQNVKKSSGNFFKKWYSLFWKILIWGLKIFNKNKDDEK